MNKKPQNWDRRAFLRSAGLVGAAFSGSSQTQSDAQTKSPAAAGGDDVGDLALNFHLMHPGGPSAPGDPNAAFYLGGEYHLHYILRHRFRGDYSYSFMHVSSPDMLNWVWHKTSLQPSFTGHGMFSGTGFLTKEGRPAVIYHGQGSGRNQIVVAKDDRLEDWERPYPVNPLTAHGEPAEISHWDPDCFLIGETYYATSGGRTPVLMRSSDLINWTYVGNLLQNDLPDVVLGEDISCGNFFRLGPKWMLLCISHSLGCRYYLGDWDATAQQFVPTIHGRMNWRREDQSLYDVVYRDYFAPESVATPDGRRVMWAWCATLDKQIDQRTIQSLPREISLAPDGTLRVSPLRELETIRYNPITLKDLQVSPATTNSQGALATRNIAELDHDAIEVRIAIQRAQAERKRFGFQLFVGERNEGVPVLIKPETGTLRVGNAEAPFVVANLPSGEDVELRIFIDKYLVEVFANERQAMITAHMDYRSATGFRAYSFADPTMIREVTIWKLRPTNRGFHEAQTRRIWAPRET